MGSARSEKTLIGGLQQALQDLSSHPYPFVAGPETLKKRASVALVVRIQPHYDHWPSPQDTGIHDLNTFFKQDWVKHGQPEVLFIKRAARKGDRWTSHIALPGGRRDPEDADDLAAAVRETQEEVGLNLCADNALQVGNLPQRVVTTHWGRVPLMVLCPYIFLITRHNMPPLRLQPTEVASTHWVPLTALLSRDQRTGIREDVSNRLASQETGVKRWMLRAMVGKMIFSAVRLLPSETVHCTATPSEKPAAKSSWIPDLLRNHTLPAAPHEQPLMLWGLTLGVLADFLDLLPPNTALELWTYPTFTPWDVRFTIWAMSYKFKQRKAREIQHIQDSRGSAVAVEEGLDAISMPKEQRLCEAGIHGLSTGTDTSFFRTELKSSAVGTMLEGYYDIVRKAVAIALIGRTTISLVVMVSLYRRLKAQRR